MNCVCEGIRNRVFHHTIILYIPCTCKIYVHYAREAESVRPHLCLCPCRYIVHSDDHNPYLASMEDFAEKLEDFNPDLLVVGGLQMMDNFPFQLGKRRLLTSFLFVAYFERHDLSEFLLFSFHQYLSLFQVSGLLSCLACPTSCPPRLHVLESILRWPVL